MVDVTRLHALQDRRIPHFLAPRPLLCLLAVGQRRIPDKRLRFGPPPAVTPPKRRRTAAPEPVDDDDRTEDYAGPPVDVSEQELDAAKAKAAALHAAAALADAAPAPAVAESDEQRIARLEADLRKRDERIDELRMDTACAAEDSWCAERVRAAVEGAHTSARLLDEQRARRRVPRRELRLPVRT